MTRLATLALLLGAVAPAHAAPAVMAYYEGTGSNASLSQFAGNLQIVAADLFNVDINGRVSGRLPKNLVALTAKNGIQLLATVSNYGAHGFDAAIAHAILTPGTAQTKAIAGMLATAKNHTGVNLDFENVRHADRALYTAFAQTLAAALHARGLTEVLSIPAETHDDPKDGWTGAYDFASLGQTADLLQVMTYDENGPWGPPGPVAGLDWVTACIDFTVGVVPLAKISMGVPAYGYDWNLSKGGGGAIAYEAVPALIAQTGATPQWDQASSSPWFTYTARNGSSHVVWYENAQSITLKAAFAAAAKIGGVSMFALGDDDAGFWTALGAGLGK
jgi:spore germination protein YaaH